MINAPATESAVQTTEPITSATVIPASPESPAFTRMTEPMIRVTNVIPDTGLVPTMAMARAATVVNRNEITNVIIRVSRPKPKLDVNT